MVIINKHYNQDVLVYFCGALIPELCNESLAYPFFPFYSSGTLEQWLSQIVLCAVPGSSSPVFFNWSVILS